MNRANLSSVATVSHHSPQVRTTSPAVCPKFAPTVHRLTQITINQPNVVIAPTTNLSHIPTTQSQEGRVTRNRNVNNFKYYTVIDGVLQEQPKIQNSTPHVVNNTTQAGQAERQILHQSQMIFSSIPPPIIAAL